VVLRQETDYPWEGAVAVHVETDAPVNFALRLRIPGWCRAWSVSINGENLGSRAKTERGYLRLERLWRPGDVVRLDLAMPVERVYAHPAVSEDAGRVALMRGPIVYCLEAIDNAAPLHRIALPRAAALAARFEPDLLGGVAVVVGEGVMAETEGWEGTLYQAVNPRLARCAIKAVPYCVWDNRAPGAMAVWLREA
jgi:DUF1680 family protein